MYIGSIEADPIKLELSMALRARDIDKGQKERLNSRSLFKSGSKLGGI